jgi:hypothetical protein
LGDFTLKKKKRARLAGKAAADGFSKALTWQREGGHGRPACHSIAACQEMANQLRHRAAEVLFMGPNLIRAAAAILGFIILPFFVITAAVGLLSSIEHLNALLRRHYHQHNHHTT